jgi:hypothetical protein
VDWYSKKSPNTWKGPLGSSNDLMALDWLEHFHHNTKDRLSKKRKQYLLLIMDGHDSHLTYEFLERYDSYNIIP